MDDLDDDMAMGVGCCAPDRNDNVSMEVQYIDHRHQNWGQQDLGVVDQMPIKTPLHPMDDNSQGLRGPIHGYC